MYNPESVLENQMRKVPRDFEIQTDHLISARQTDLVIVNKNLWSCGFYRSSRLRSKNKRKQKDRQILRAWQRTKKNVEVRLERYPNVSIGNWRNWKSNKELKPSRTLYCRDQSEYREEFWRCEEICCYSGSCERPPVNIDEKKKLTRSKIIISPAREKKLTRSKIIISPAREKKLTRSKIIISPAREKKLTRIKIIISPAREKRLTRSKIIISPAREKKLTRSKIIISPARGVMVIVLGNGHGDTRSNPGPG